MKFLLVLATTALADNILQADIAAIASNVAALQTAVKGFQGVQQADGLVASSQAVVGSITKATDDANKSPPLKLDAALGLTGPIEQLMNVVRETVDSLISKKGALAASGRGCEVVPQLRAQKAGTKAFTAALAPKLPADLQPLAPELSAPIVASLDKGLAAFKDVQCASATTATSTTRAAATGTSASTTTVETTTTTVAVTMTTTAGSTSGTAATSGAATATETTLTGTTGIYTATATATSVATSTETASCPPPDTIIVTKTEPCDTETAGPTGGHGTQTTDGSGSHPTGGHGGKPPGSQPRPESQLTGGNGGNPGSQSDGGNGQTPGSQPTGGNRGNPGSGGSGPEPTTLVPVPTGGNPGTSPAGPSPTSPVVVAGAARGHVCFSVTFAAIIGVIGAVAL